TTAVVVPIVQPSLPKANRFLSDEKVEVEGTPKEENIVDKPDVVNSDVNPKRKRTCIEKPINVEDSAG
ncbi:hypothetical protein HAX54_004638, partial [Datura stramonium]|nr:hypothetical protein [Datura stramonium]